METERKALEKTKAVWLEMAVKGYRRKADYFKRIGEKDKYWLDCPLCELYAKGRKGQSNECKSCPFQVFGALQGCMNDSSPYRFWLENGLKNRRYNALKVYNFLAKVYRERYRGNKWKY